jgi:hypothetical protein
MRHIRLIIPISTSYGVMNGSFLARRRNHPVWHAICLLRGFVIQENRAILKKTNLQSGNGESK